MARTYREPNIPKAWHHVMNRGRWRELTFLDDADFRGYVDLLRTTFKRKRGFSEGGIRGKEENS